jgi:hypothetical protein
VFEDYMKYNCISHTRDSNGTKLFSIWTEIIKTDGLDMGTSTSATKLENVFKPWNSNIPNINKTPNNHILKIC